MRCKHLNGELGEVMSATHARMVRNGKVDECGLNDVGNIEGYFFRCFDCRKEFDFVRKSNVPKWMQRMIDAL